MDRSTLQKFLNALQPVSSAIGMVNLAFPPSTGWPMSRPHFFSNPFILPPLYLSNRSPLFFTPLLPTSILIFFLHTHKKKLIVPWNVDAPGKITGFPFVFWWLNGNSFVITTWILFSWKICYSYWTSFREFNKVNPALAPSLLTKIWKVCMSSSILTVPKSNYIYMYLETIFISMCYVGSTRICSNWGVHFGCPSKDFTM